MASIQAGSGARYSVGGVLLPRPFQIRRLGHAGYNVADVDRCAQFYRQQLGFRKSDALDFRRSIQNEALRSRIGEQSGCFLRHNGDHHSLVLVNREAMAALDHDGKFSPDVTVNQITFQVNTLQEVVDAAAFLHDAGVRMLRTGRDTPGSNWHTYVFDPDGHIIELYYGIEQIGWNGRSKPSTLFRGFRTAPPVPQICEQAELADALAKGVDVGAGFAERFGGEAVHDVGGVLLPRPFSVAGIGPIRLFAKDLAASRRFYEEKLGFRVTAEREVLGCKVLFLRAGAEHHVLALYDVALRGRLPVRQDTTSLSFGVRVGSYAQLRAAVRWLKDKGVAFLAMPPELSVGIRYTAFVNDPEGHLVELYSEMEQVCPDGRAREHSTLPDPCHDRWPEAIEPLESTFLGEPFLGPML
jgi:catechol 2,3-dioxygenase-like lactoylglutathione lyase family enzyme